ncbi:heme O synthase-like polyprenyltransferase [Catalinimonas alkaloidigena]|uniref:UbiA-like protein EboC n=1 Tax=Catalinimonas alkaloidigena TaxID=1075417 RepID=UPI002406CF6A|nr:UbiA-like protein EboC [Catalinimonas alkaloidigena]MDF9800678.1 heme O synthase-like polyprenyltransferase [Catalinimonas alkaloidigena]
MKKLIAHVKLMRPANVITAIADIMAGFAASGLAIQWIDNGDHSESLMWLALATIGLYAGGVVFNDVFDAELDRIERPERPIPSGDASLVSASLLGAILLILGVLSAWMISLLSLLIAFLVAACALLYDAWGKHQNIWGPINMGMCRGGNLLLGVSVVPAVIGEVWYISLIPVIYIAAITMISRGEVHGGNRQAIRGAAFMYGFIFICILLLAFLFNQVYWQVIPFLALLSYFIFPPLFKALRNPEPRLVGLAVKAGVLSLIILDAALATAFTGWFYGLVVLLLFPISRLVGKAFAVT